MLITKEYSLLVGQNGCADRRILPGVEFEPFEGDYIVSSYARIKYVDSSIHITIKPGERIKGIGTIEKPKRKRKAKDDI